MNEITRTDKSNGLRLHATGAQGRFLVRQRQVNPNCDFTDLYGSGVAIWLVDNSGNVTNKYLWFGFIYENDPGVMGMNFFGPTWEGWWQNDWRTGGCYQPGFCTGSLGFAVGAHCNYKINQIFGTDDWAFWSQCDANDWYKLGVANDTGFTQGVPVSVTYRRGGHQTGMKDDIDSLYYRSADGDSWNLWGTNNVYDGPGDPPNDWAITNVHDVAYDIRSI